jgi:hypothetical protein
MRSKSTPGSSTQHRHSTELKQDVQPYQIQKPAALSLSTRFTQVFSTPNLRGNSPSERDRKLRRSHSANSMRLPKPSPLSPLRLPSLTTCDKDGMPWADVMSASLRLSQFPVPPHHVNLRPSKTTVAEFPVGNVSQSKGDTEHIRTGEQDSSARDACPTLPGRAIEIRVQQPTSVATPRQSTSIREAFRENGPPVRDAGIERIQDDDEDENSRRSVHLYSMRISHHLRSGSLLSWDQLAADTSDLPTPHCLLRERTVSDQSRTSCLQTPLVRHERQSSSSGFASNKIPSKWGKVLAPDRDFRNDVASSIYSSRPQSPPDSFGGSMANLSRAASGHHHFTQSSVDLRKLRRSNSFPTDNEETPRPAQRYGLTNLVAAQDCSTDVPLLIASAQVARKHSVVDTKTSKFREEFSPSPPRKKIVQSTSLMKFLNPKRLSLRSLSEANIQSGATPNSNLDGPSDTLPIPADGERRQSRSLISLKAEQDALGKNKGANHVWDQALKAHQEEKASMFLPKNKDLAVHASPFRERSGSFTSRRPSFQEDTSPGAEPSTPKRFSAPMLAPQAFQDTENGRLSRSFSRRTATTGTNDTGVGQEVAIVFDRQGDGAAVVGAWGRFPSHTRLERTLSAGKVDRIETRDFALEAAIRFAAAKDNAYDEDLVDPIERRPSPPLLPGTKKRKKKVGTGKMVKSHSMTFGRKLIKNYYSGMFKSSSAEFRRHGRGHRSSIASGGTLEHPELELLPEVFMFGETDGTSGSGPSRKGKQVARRHSERHSEAKPKVKLPIGDSMATLRPRRNSSAPNLNDLVNLHDEADDPVQGPNRARVWSVYYETCVPSFPRMSTDGDDTLFEDFGSPSHISFDSKRPSMHSRTLPSRLHRHSRNGSQLSRRSTMSRASVHHSMGGDDAAGEEKSLVSVRRSTMDLLSKFKEQEHTEHERVLSLTRAESRREIEVL